MPIIFSASNPVSEADQQVVVVGSPTISNTLFALADTEQSIALPSGIRKFFLNARGSSQLRLAYTLGGTSVAYKLIRAGVLYESPALNGENLTLYIKSSQAGETVEIESWV
jgi:hypothetical protein